MGWNILDTQLRNQIRGWGRQGALAEIESQTFLIRRASIIDGMSVTAFHKPETLLERSGKGMWI